MPFNPGLKIGQNNNKNRIRDPSILLQTGGFPLTFHCDSIVIYAVHYFSLAILYIHHTADIFADVVHPADFIFLEQSQRRMLSAP
jgi:hypothetical protein